VLKKRKLFVVLGAVALAVVTTTFMLARTGGSAANADAGTFESMLAAKAGISIDTLHMVESAALNVVADRSVNDGKLTADEATQLRGISLSPLLEQAFSDLATATNTSEQDLFTGLLNHESLAQIASASGVDATTLKSRISQIANNDIDTAVQNGIISPDMASSAKAKLNDTNLEKAINWTLPDHSDQQH
jgi:polyhydroxyalkanoate synthesis regulator phasin